jgi:hypothetical protein
VNEFVINQKEKSVREILQKKKKQNMGQDATKVAGVLIPAPVSRHQRSSFCEQIISGRT